MKEFSAEPSSFNAMQRYGPLMQLVPPDERRSVFVKRDAVRESRIPES